MKLEQVHGVNGRLPVKNTGYITKASDDAVRVATDDKQECRSGKYAPERKHATTLAMQSTIDELAGQIAWFIQRLADDDMVIANNNYARDVWLMNATHSMVQNADGFS